MCQSRVLSCAGHPRLHDHLSTRLGQPPTIGQLLVVRVAAPVGGTVVSRRDALAIPCGECIDRVPDKLPKPAWANMWYPGTYGATWAHAFTRCRSLPMTARYKRWDSPVVTGAR